MKTIAKLLALCLLLGTFAVAQQTPAAGGAPAPSTDTKSGDTKTDSKDAKGKKAKKKKDKKDQKADTTKTDTPK